MKNVFRDWLSDLRSTPPNRSTHRAASTRRRNRAQLLPRLGIIESLEDRVVLSADNAFPLYELYGPTTSEVTARLVALGDNAEWRNDATTSPVQFGNNVLSSDLLAPDGAKILAADGARPDHRSLLVSNGLLTMGDGRFVPQDYSNQQEFETTGIAGDKTFQLKWNGQTTSPLRVGVSADEMRDALQALSNIGPVGGEVTVTRSTNGSRYVITFAGTTWFRPPIIQAAISDGTVKPANPVFRVPLTKRIEGTPVQVDFQRFQFGYVFKLDLPNPNTFAVDNAPSFTPEVVAQTPRPGSFGAVSDRKLKGYLQVPGITGRFDSKSEYNAATGESRPGIGYVDGLRITDAGSEYNLNGLRDGAGNTRPISLFKMGGLDFTVPAGSRAALMAKDADQNELEFVSLEDSLLATAVFDGGSITYRLMRDNGAPLFRADLRSGKVTVTSKMEPVSAVLGGFTIPSSNAFKITYDAPAERFSFAIDNLALQSAVPTGFATLGADPGINSVTQVFEHTGLSISGSTYEFAIKNPATAFPREPFNSIAEFDAASKTTGTNPAGFWLNEPVEQRFSTDVGRGYGIRFKTTIKAPATGEYQFFAAGRNAARHELKINGNLVTQGSGSDSSGSITLVAGVSYSFELTYITRGGGEGFVGAPPIQWSGPGLRNTAPLYQEDAYYLARYTSAGGIQEAAFSNRSYERSPITTQSMRDKVLAIIDTQTGLTVNERDELKAKVKISVEDNGNRVTITDLPFAIVFKLQSSYSGDDICWTNAYRGVVTSPVKLIVPSGIVTITKGKVDPVVGIAVNSFEIGQTNITSDGSLVTTFEPFQVSGGGGLKLGYYPLNTYDSDGNVNVAGNSFGLCGNQTKLMVSAAGVTLGGSNAGDLGDERTPGIIITNAQFDRLRYPVPDLKVANLSFVAASVGSTRAMTVNMRPPRGTDRKSFVVEGGALMKPVGLITSDVRVVFGGYQTDGLRIFPDANSYTMSFDLMYEMLIGNGIIVSNRSGSKVVQDPQTRALNLMGEAVIEFDAKAPHTLAEVQSRSYPITGQLLRFGFDLPYATGIAPNRLDGDTLNLFLTSTYNPTYTVGQGIAINGFYLLGRHPSQNPLRLTLTNSTQTFGGVFKMSLSGNQLNGAIVPTQLTNLRLPTTPLMLDFTSVPGEPAGLTLGGALLEGAGLSPLAETLALKFKSSKFDGNVLAEGVAGSEPNVIEARDARLTKAEIRSTGARAIGDIAFQNFVATFNPNAVPSAWRFTGPGTYFGKPVDVGSPTANNPQLLIGGDPQKGYQLRTLNEPFDPMMPSFPLPNVINMAGLSFNVGAMPQDVPVLDEGSSKTYSLKTPDYKVRLGNTELSLNLAMKVKVSFSGAEVVSFSATVQQNSKFSVGNATFQVESLKVLYDVAEKAIEISGSARFTFKAGSGNVDMTVTLGSEQDPGLVIKDGSIDSLVASVDGNFEILKLSAQAKGLTVSYKKENAEFAVYGSIGVSTAAQGGVQVIKDLTVSLGNEHTPGIVIAGGSLKSLDFSVNGEINLFRLTATPKDLRVRYRAAENQLQITGELSLTLAPKLTLTAGLPGNGLTIDTSTGRVQVQGLSLKADGNIKFGVLTIKDLHVDYQESANGDVTIGAGAEIELPSGLAVGGSFKIINGRLDAISISFERNPGILVANGLVNIFRLEVSVEGLSDLENFKFTGSVTASVGPLVKFGGESYALATVKGTIEITPQYLALRGDVDLVGGKLGTGTFEGKLIWSGTPRVTFTGDFNLARGAVRGQVSAYADINGNIDFNGDVGVYVPKGVPLAGGVSLGRLQVELRVRPAEPPTASYLKFAFSDIAINFARIPTLFGSLRIDFDRNVGFEFGAKFFIPLPWPLPDINYKLSFRGSFKLFDGSNPVVEVLAAAALPGSPDGEIRFSSMTPFPDGTTIDLYADHDNQGNDGMLIASSIPYQAGTQTYVWKDMSTFAAPGEPVYVYAVISDGQHARGYSDYSAPFNVSAGFRPTLNNPVSVTTGIGDPVIFSTSSGRPIVVTDPRSSRLPDSELEVVLSAAEGTLDLPRVPDRVRYTGAGTTEFTLRGTAADINAALDGMFYTPDGLGDGENDAIEISVRALPNEGAEPVRGKIDVQFKSISLFLDGSNAGLDLGGIQQQLDAMPVEVNQSNFPLQSLEITDLHSEFVTGATVKINNFEMGDELLELPMNEALLTGIQSHFDHNTGMLMLTGFGRIADYQLALENVIFTTSSMSGGKSLTVSLEDTEGDRGQFTLPLQVIEGDVAPELNFSTLGLAYVAGSGPQALAPDAYINVDDDSFFQRISITFVQNSYVAGEDVLACGGTNPNFAAEFDNDLGVLTLTGEGTEDDWNFALQQVTYQSLGGASGVPFTEGFRYLQITAEDGAGTSGSGWVVVATSSNPETYASPALTLSGHVRQLDANMDTLYLDPNLTLTSTAPLLIGATVAIGDGYVAGEQELVVSSLWDGMTADFDPLTGVLSIQGAATPFQYQDVLRSVMFISAGGMQTAGSVLMTYSVNDGISSTESEPFKLNVKSAPFLATVLDNVITYTHGRETLRIHDGFQIQFDRTLTGAVVRISSGFQADEDELLFTPQAGITGEYNAETGVLTLTGNATITNYARVLASVAYRNSRYNPVAGERVVSFQVQRFTVTSNVSDALISVEPVVVAPKVTIGTTSAFTEDGNAVPVAPNFSLAPMDATTPELSTPEMLYGAEIHITNFVPGEDELRFAASDKISGDYDAIEGRIYLTGSASFDEYEAAIRSVTYRNTSQVPNTAPRQVSIRLLDSGANGLSNQTLSTQVVVGLPDPITMTAGSVEEIVVMTNGESSSLALGDLAFVSNGMVDPRFELRFMAAELPDDLLGRIVLADGTPLTVTDSYSMAELAGLRFEQADGGMGTASFSFTVLLHDTETDQLDSEGFTQTVQIEVEGVETRTQSEAYVAQVYRDLLHRNPDADTIGAEASHLDDRLRRIGRSTEGFGDAIAARQHWLSAFTSSDGYRQARVQDLYLSLLGRNPSQSETMAQGSFEQIQLGVLGSAEYFGQHNEAGYDSYVSSVYQSLLGRDPSATERSSAVARLQNGVPFATVLAGINGGAGLTDADRHALVDSLLHRPYELNDEFAFDFSSRDRLTLSILASDEFYARYAMPSVSDRIRTQETTEFTSVGTLGDISGGKATGTLIAPQYVLVAAHSVATAPPGQLTFTIGGVVHRIDHVFIHPDYRSDLQGEDGASDIAILKLDTAVNNITPSRLTGRAPRLGEMLSLVGFGQDNGSEFGTKRIGSTPPVDEVGATIFRWTQTSAMQNDSDPGDSGAPLFAAIEGVPFIIGVVSGGTSFFEGVGDVATNTRVDKYVDWIQTITGSLNVSNQADAPSLIFESNNVFIDENDGPRTVGFVVSGDEPITYMVTTNKPEMFKTLFIDYDGRGQGDLVYETNINRRGTAQVFITATSGGLSVTETLNITAEERNDPPTIDPLQALVLNRGTQAVPLTGISAGLGETNSVTVRLANVTSPDLFSTINLTYAPDSSTASLNVAPALNATGRASVTVEVTDTDDKGAPHTTISQTFTVEFTDAPVTGKVVNGLLMLNDSKGIATDLRLDTDPATGELIVSSFVGGVKANEFRLATDVAITAINAMLGPQADRFNASGLVIPVTINGGNGDDVLVGSQASDMLFGGAGRDSLVGGEGNDSLFGQGAVDTLDGGSGIDSLDGGVSGSAIIDQVEGSLTLTDTGYTSSRGDRALGASIGYAILTGGSGPDFFLTTGYTAGLVVIYGGEGNDTMQGGGTMEAFYGEGGNDMLVGGGNRDYLFGGDGNDTINGVGASDVLSGGSGNDLILGGTGDNELREFVNGTLTVGTNSTTGEVTITGLGNDAVKNTFTSVVLIGGDDNDVLDVSGFNGTAMLLGGSGNDDLRGTAKADRIYGEAGNDTVSGNSGNDFLQGNLGNDSVTGDQGDDTLYGNENDDTLHGAEGNDRLDGGPGNDRALELGNTNITIVGTRIQSPLLGTDITLAVEFFQLQSGSAANILDARRSSLPVLLAGGSGNDTLLGSPFNDTLLGGVGDDVLSGGSGNDELQGNVGRDIHYETANSDFTVTGTKVTANVIGTDLSDSIESIVLIGGLSANKLDASLATVPVVLIGGRGNDTLLGGSAADTLSGGNRGDASVMGGDGIDSLNGGGGADTLENDPADNNTLAAGDTSIADVFSLLPSWIDSL